MIARAFVTFLFVVATGSVCASDTRVELARDLFLEPLAPGVWRHVSSKEVEGWGLVAANGLVVVSDGEAALVDTPWTGAQVRLIAAWLESAQGARLTIVVPTHFHEDCLGGLAEAHELGASSYASRKTIELAAKAGHVVPENGFEKRLDLSVGLSVLTLEEAGAGHTVDNIVVWIPQQHVLFGGCLVKSSESTTKGYLADADLDAWPRTMDEVAKRFADAKIVVPGHGAPGGLELLAHTKALISE